MVKHVCTQIRLAVAVVTLTTIGTSTTLQARQEQNAPPQPRQILMTGAEDSRPTTARDIAGMEDLLRMIDRSSEGLEIVQHPDGRESINLRGRFMSLAIARPQPDATQPVSCLVGTEALAALEAATRPDPTRSPLEPAALRKPIAKIGPAQLEEKE